MARTVAVRLKAEVAGYVSGMRDAAAATKTMSDSVKRGVGQASRELRDFKTESTIAGAALLALPAMAVKAAMGFDKEMSKVAAVANATADEMDALRQAAIKAGADTSFSAGESATAISELAKAGVSTSAILGGALAGSLDLAAAGGLALADAATIAAQAMNVFDLGGSDVARVADTLAAGANKSAADVGQLGEALRQGGLLAKQTGLGLEDTVGVLSAFADNALIGSDAGTSLKTMLMRLTPQSKEAKEEMDRLNLSAYDAAGNFVGLENFAGQLRDSLADLTPEARNSALQVIFGADAARAAGVLYDIGADGVRDYTAAVDDQGAAARMAAVQLDNLAGDLEQLSGSIETAFIQAGSSGTTVLRAMTQGATGAVNAVGSLPAPLLGTAAAISALSGAFLIAAPRIVAFNEALAKSPGLARAAGVGLRAIAGAVAVAAVVSLATEFANAREEADDLEDRVDSLYLSLGRGFSTDGITALREEIRGVRDDIEGMGFLDKAMAGWEYAWENRGPMLGRDSSQEAALTSWQREERALASLEARYSSYTEAIGAAAFELGTTTTRAQELAAAGNVNLHGSVEDVTARIVSYARTQSTGTVATQAASAAIDILADSTASAADKAKALDAIWQGTFGTLLDSSNATIAAEAALDALTASIEENGNEWDVNTEAGRKNLDARNNLIAAAKKVYDSAIAEGKGTDVATEAYNKYLTRAAKAPGLTRAQRRAVRELVDEYKMVPPKVETDVRADTSQAMAALRILAAEYARLGSSYTIGGSTYSSQVPRGRAAGGKITGPGTGTSDSIPAMLSDGEWVINAATSARMGDDFMAALNAGQVRRFASGGKSGKTEKRTTWDRQYRKSIRFENSPLDAWDFGALERATDAAEAATTALADAKRSVADADMAIADARRAVNTAGSPEEQAAAARQLADAEADKTRALVDQAQAQRDLNTAEAEKKAAAPTGANILARFRARAAKLDKFRRDLATLRKRGLAPGILRELLDAGIEEGGAMAAALVKDGNIAALNSTWRAIGADATALARNYGDRVQVPGTSAGSSGSGTGSTSGSVGSTTATVSLSIASASKPFIVKMENRTVWKGLLDLKQERGGASLGLS